MPSFRRKLFLPLLLAALWTIATTTAVAQDGSRESLRQLLQRAATSDDASRLDALDELASPARIEEARHADFALAPYLSDLANTVTNCDLEWRYRSPVFPLLLLWQSNEVSWNSNEIDPLDYAVDAVYDVAMDDADRGHSSALEQLLSIANSSSISFVGGNVVTRPFSITPSSRRLTSDRLLRAVLDNRSTLARRIREPNSDLNRAVTAWTTFNYATIVKPPNLFARDIAIMELRQFKGERRLHQIVEQHREEFTLQMLQTLLPVIQAALNSSHQRTRETAWRQMEAVFPLVDDAFYKTRPSAAGDLTIGAEAKDDLHGVAVNLLRACADEPSFRGRDDAANSLRDVAGSDEARNLAEAMRVAVGLRAGSPPREISERALDGIDPDLIDLFSDPAFGAQFEAILPTISNGAAERESLLTVLTSLLHCEEDTLFGAAAKRAEELVDQERFSATLRDPDPSDTTRTVQLMLHMTTYVAIFGGKYIPKSNEDARNKLRVLNGKKVLDRWIVDGSKKSGAEFQLGAEALAAKYLIVDGRNRQSADFVLLEGWLVDGVLDPYLNGPESNWMARSVVLALANYFLINGRITGNIDPLRLGAAISRLFNGAFIGVEPMLRPVLRMGIQMTDPVAWLMSLYTLRLIAQGSTHLSHDKSFGQLQRAAIDTARNIIELNKIPEFVERMPKRSRTNLPAVAMAPLLRVCESLLDFFARVAYPPGSVVSAPAALSDQQLRLTQQRIAVEDGPKPRLPGPPRSPDGSPKPNAGAVLLPFGLTRTSTRAEPPRSNALTDLAIVGGNTASLLDREAAAQRLVGLDLTKAPSATAEEFARPLVDAALRLVKAEGNGVPRSAVWCWQTIGAVLTGKISVGALFDRSLHWRIVEAILNDLSSWESKDITDSGVKTLMQNDDFLTLLTAARRDNRVKAQRLLWEILAQGLRGDQLAFEAAYRVGAKIATEHTYLNITEATPDVGLATAQLTVAHLLWDQAVPNDLPTHFRARTALVSAMQSGAIRYLIVASNTEAAVDSAWTAMVDLAGDPLAPAHELTAELQRELFRVTLSPVQARLQRALVVIREGNDEEPLEDACRALRVVPFENSSSTTITEAATTIVRRLEAPRGNLAPHVAQAFINTLSVWVSFAPVRSLLTESALRGAFAKYVQHERYSTVFAATGRLVLALSRQSTVHIDTARQIEQRSNLPPTHVWDDANDTEDALTRYMETPWIVLDRVNDPHLIEEAMRDPDVELEQRLRYYYYVGLVADDNSWPIMERRHAAMLLDAWDENGILGGMFVDPDELEQQIATADSTLAESDYSLETLSAVLALRTALVANVASIPVRAKARETFLALTAPTGPDGNRRIDALLNSAAAPVQFATITLLRRTLEEGCQNLAADPGFWNEPLERVSAVLDNAHLLNLNQRLALTEAREDLKERRNILGDLDADTALSARLIDYVQIHLDILASEVALQLTGTEPANYAQMIYSLLEIFGRHLLTVNDIGAIISRLNERPLLRDENRLVIYRLFINMQRANRRTPLFDQNQLTRLRRGLRIADPAGPNDLLPLPQREGIDLLIAQYRPDAAAEYAEYQRLRGSEILGYGTLPHYYGQKLFLASHALHDMTPSIPNHVIRDTVMRLPRVP